MTKKQEKEEKKVQVPKKRADAFYFDEDDEKTQRYTNFERLEKMMEKVIETVDEHAQVLNENDMKVTKRPHGVQVWEAFDELETEHRE